LVSQSQIANAPAGCQIHLCCLAACIQKWGMHCTFERLASSM